MESGWKDWEQFTHDWRKLVEKRLDELGSMVHGQQAFMAKRILDTVEQIDELRQEVRQLSERLDKARQYIKTHLPKGNGE